MNAHLMQEADFIRQSEHELTTFEVRSYTRILLSSINSMFVKDLESNKYKVLDCIDKLLENNEIVCMLTEIRHLDDYTFEHSVNVSVLSLMCSVLMGYREEHLMELGAGAILHDVGKTKVKEEILKKPSKLTNDEYEEIKLHTKYGFEIINNCASLSKKSAYIANAHHERVNGKGYPIGISGLQISEEAKVVAIADVYDALVSDRIYRSKMWPGEVLDYILSQESGFFDDEILRVFIQFVAVYPIGTHVVLSNNKKGIVFKDNMSIPSKPLVKLLDMKNLHNKVHDEFLDLAEIKDIYISSAIEI